MNQIDRRKLDRMKQQMPISDGTITINGVRIDAAGLMSLFMIAFESEPDKWYRFEKVGDQLMIEVSKEESAIQ